MDSFFAGHATSPILNGRKIIWYCFVNPGFEHLHPYPFEKLTALKAEAPVVSDKPPISLSIGEPKHETPEFILETLRDKLNLAAVYPKTKGSDDLRQTIADWLEKRFQLPAGSINAQDNVLPVNGTREAIFAFAQTVIDSSQPAHVLMPNPFYQIYEGAALLAGAQPYFLNLEQDNDYLPVFEDVPESIWQSCQLFYLCSPNNPTGSVIKLETVKQLLTLADKYDFVIAADECYSEIYFNEAEPPKGLLQLCAELGREDYARCVVFHSLSKRSNVPGIRSGFVAGDKNLLAEFLRYRTYHGCAMSDFIQAASIAAWSDENHVRENRRLYTQKFNQVLEILQPLMKVEYPEAAFYLWPETAVSDTVFARELYRQQQVTVLPGSYLSRDAHGKNPGTNRVRIALVADVAECLDAANRIAEFIKSL